MRSNIDLSNRRRSPRSRAAQRGVTTAEYIVLAAVLVLGLVAAVSLFKGRVSDSLATEGEAVGAVARGNIAPVRDRYGDGSGQPAQAASATDTAQAGLAGAAEPENAVLGAPRGGGGRGPASGGAGQSGGGAAGGDAATPPAVKTGLGEDIDKAVGQSAKLSQGLKALKDKGWKFDYGTAGGGSFCDRDAKKIVLDANEKGKVSEVLTTLAHEMGHAAYKPDAYVDIGDLSREQFVDANVMRSLKDEGEAVLTNIEVRKELAAAGGTRISVAGAGASKYEKIYKDYLTHGDRDRARTEIARAFGDNEHPSTDPSKTYTQYYGKPFADYYDSVKKTKPVARTR
jgi:type VI secretion system secreted protein VgrG